MTLMIILQTFAWKVLKILVRIYIGPELLITF